MTKTGLFSVGDTVGDHWTVVAVLSPKSFIVECSCGTQSVKDAGALLGKTPRSNGCRDGNHSKKASTP